MRQATVRSALLGRASAVILLSMSREYYCPFVDSMVELSDEREAHIRRFHPEVMTEGRNLIGRTLDDPDLVRRDLREPASTRLFSRWYDRLRGGRHVVVSVVTEANRHWVVTAFTAQTIEERDVEWERT